MTLYLLMDLLLYDQQQLKACFLIGIAACLLDVAATARQVKSSPASDPHLPEAS